MKLGEAVVLWILTTVWICIEVAFLAAPEPNITQAQMDVAMEHLQEAGNAVGFRNVQLFVAAAFLWVVKGVVGLVVMLLVGVEVVRWFRRHPPVAIPQEADA